MERPPFLETVEWSAIFKDEVVGDGEDLLVGVGKTPL